MSGGAKVPRAVALPVAESVLEIVRLFSERAEIAGSLRRGAGSVGDIEIVCVPKAERDLFGAPTGCLLTHVIAENVRAVPGWRWRTETHPLPKTKEPRRFWPLVVGGIPCDIFAVRPPAQWGAILAIRTGPADFSRQLVTACLRRDLRCTEGRLVRGLDTVPTPTERDFFRECGVAWAEPGERR